MENNQFEKLENLQKKLGDCIIKARPYFDTLKQIEYVSYLKTLNLCSSNVTYSILFIYLFTFSYSITVAKRNATSGSRVSESD